jgi:hypothetical protein
VAEAAVPPSIRLRSALSLALIGALTLSPLLAAHDILSFGPRGHDLIAPWGTNCTEWPCATMNLVVSGQIAKGIGAALVFALIGAVTISFRGRLGLGGAAWVVQYFWSLVGIASGYRGHFGTDWRWWDPFAKLLWSPGLTLGLMVCGLGAFLGLSWITTTRR